MSSCMEKWKTYPSHFEGYVSKLLNTGSSYEDLVLTIKLLEGEEFGDDFVATITQADISYLLNKARSLASDPDTFINLDRVYKNLDSIFGNDTSIIISSENAKFFPQQTDKLIPILSADLNVFVEQRLRNYAFNISVYDPELGIMGPDQLKSSIISFKNYLFGILQEYLGEETLSLYDNIDETIDYGLYQQIMENAWSKISNELNSDGIYEGFRNDPRTLRFLQVVEAFYILQNFDQFISNFSDGLVSINGNKVGSTEVSDEKYKLYEQHKVNTSYEGNHSDHDSDKQLNKVFARYWESIKLADGSFLSIKDFKKLVEYIKNAINEGTDSTWDFLVKSDNTVRNGKRSMDIAIINALRDDRRLHRFLGHDGAAICNAVADRFELFVGTNNSPGHYQEYLQDNDLSVQEKANLETNRHFLIQFRNECINRENRAQASYTPEKELQTLSDARLSQSKETITSKIKASVIKHIKDLDFGIYSPTLLIDRYGTNIFSDQFVSFVNELTGLRLSTTQLERFAQSEESIKILLDFLDGFVELVQSDVIAKIRYKHAINGKRDVDVEKAIINQFMKKLKTDPRYLDFSNLYIKQNRNDVSKMLDQGGNAQPIQITTSTVIQYKKNLTEYVEQRQKVRRRGTPQNILALFPSLTTSAKYNGLTSSSNRYAEHIVYRQDCAYTDSYGTKVIKAVEMSPDETLTMAFCGEFFDSIVKHGTFYNQIDCYSDKVTIALAAYNMLGEVEIDGKKRQFVNLRSDELFKLWGNQRADYYQTVAEQIIRDLTLLFGPEYEGKTLEQLIEKLETYKASAFEKLVANHNRNNPPELQVNVVKEIHYSGKDEKPCQFNKTLYFNIKETQNGVGKYLERYYNEGFQEFVKSLEAITIPTQYRSSSFIENHKEVLLDLFGLDPDTDISVLQDFFKIDTINNEDISWVQYELDQDGKKVLTKLSKELISKYYALQALSADAELQITSKENTIHENKQGISEELKNCTIADYGTEKFYEYIKEDQSGRLVNGKKRNNSEVASYLPMDTTSTYGVSTHSRIAVVYSRKQDFQNYNGQTNGGQDVVDGSLQTLGIAAVWERHSYPSKTVSGTKKVIGLVPSLTTMSQYKCADFVLDNIYILNTHHNQNEYTTNNLVRAKKMMKSGVFTPSFYQAYSNVDSLPSIGVNVCRYKGSHLLSLARVECIDPVRHIMKFYWQNAEADSPSMMYTEEYPINNVYELWQALGAEYTVEEKNGVWIPSNGSMEYIAYAISEHDPSVKQSMVSKIVDVSANKSGITNINTLEEVDTDNDLELNTTMIDNSRWGMQQDYSHESDESTIPSLSQVISAIAFNGKNIKLVGDMYETLAQLTLLKAHDLKITFDHGENPQAEFNFHYKLVEQLTRSLETGATRSDALTLTYEVKEAMDKIIEEHQERLGVRKEDGTILPFSSPDIFYKLASDFISNLNKKSIRQTFNGIALVQNPSHSNIALYDGFENGEVKVFKKFDLLQIGRTEHKEKINPSMNENQIIEIVLTHDSRFKPIPTNANELELEDWVSFTYTDNKGKLTRVERRIVHPSQLIDLANGRFNVGTRKDPMEVAIHPESLNKLFGRSRDLKVPNVHFYTGIDERGQLTGYQNLWLTEAIKTRASLEKNKQSNPAEYKKSLQWHRANLEGLGSEKPYYYATLQDFEASRLRTGLNPDLGKTFVYGVTFVPGEQIIPKVNKSVQSLGAASLAEIESKGPSYFVAQMRQNYTRTCPMSVYDVDGGIAYTNNSSESILSVVRSKDEIIYAQFPHPDLYRFTKTDSNAIVKYDNKYYFQDSNFNRLFEVPSNRSIVYQTEMNGKKIYYVQDANALNEQLEEIIRNTEDLNALYVDSLSGVINYRNLQKEVNKIIDTTKTPEQIKLDIDKQAELMFQSFKLSNYTISARIPSQSFQSFMANKTAAFMDSDINDGYVNIFEIWFQGSDYDIDKAYTMMYELDKSGIIAGVSPILVLDNHDLLLKSLQLPLPDKSKIIGQIGDINITKELISIVDKYSINGPVQNLKDAYSWIKQLPKATYLELMNELLQAVKNAPGKPVVDDDSNGGLVQLLNEHNSFKVKSAGLKNRVMSMIYHCAKDLKNLEASSQPMAMKGITDLIDEIEDERGTKKKVYNNINPYTKFAIQYENSVGKKNVGIAANGVKGAAAIQQYFNEYYQTWDPSTPIDPSYEIKDMNLQFHETMLDSEGKTITRDIYTDCIFHVGDVVMTKEQHAALAAGKPLTSSKDFRVLQHFLRSGFINVDTSKPNHKRIEPLKEGTTNPIVTDFYTAEGKLKSEYQDLKSTWELFRPHGLQVGETLANVWQEFLYFKRGFNANVADMISIFISLATDNAKELALARINATPELMAIPITMLTLGMPPKAVLDICITCLDPIAKKLKVNRLQNAGSRNVRNFIADESSFDKATKTSLLRIYDAAQEMRAITSFFKINQGLTAQYVELLGFYKNLSAVLPQMAKRRGDVTTEVLPLDLHLLFSTDKKGTQEYQDYKDQQIQLMNDTRSAFNVLDIVTKNKNFSAMLEAMETQLTSLQYAAGIAKFVSIRSIINSERTEQLTAAEYRNLIRVYQDFILGKVLKSKTFSTVKFTTQSLIDQFGLTPGELNLPYQSGQQFGLDSDEGVSNFVHLVETIIIPRLQELYPNNFFLKSLVEEHNKYLDKNVYILNYDVFNDSDVAEQQNVLNAVLALKEIAEYNSGLTTVFGQSISIGDIFFLYDAIVHKQKMSGLNLAVKTSANYTQSKFAKAITDTYVEYDEKSRNPALQDQLMEEFSELDLVQEAALKNMKAESTTGESINLRGHYIWSFVPVTNSRMSISDIIEHYKANGTISNYEMEARETNDDKVHMLILTIHTPYQTISHVEYKSGSIPKNVDISHFTGLGTAGNDLQEALSFAELLVKTNQSVGLKSVAISEYLNKAGNAGIKNVLTKAYNLHQPALHQITESSKSILSEAIEGYVQRLPNNEKVIILPSFTSDYQVLDLILESEVGSDIVQKVQKLKSIIEETPDSKNVMGQYLSYLSNKTPGKEVIKKCLVLEQQGLKYLEDYSTYYRMPTKSEKTKTNKIENLAIGDLVSFKGQVGVSPNATFMYAGMIQGQHTFKNMSMNDNGHTSSQIRRLAKNDPLFERMTITGKLLIPFGYNPLVKRFVESGITFKLGEKPVQSGDILVLDDGAEASVCKVVYLPNDEGKPTEAYISYVYGQFELIEPESVEIVQKNKTNMTTASAPRPNHYKINHKFEQAEMLISKLEFGDLVDVGNDTKVPFEGFVSKTQIQAGGKIYNTAEITTIYSIVPKYIDVEFEHDTTPLRVINDQTALNFLEHYKGFEVFEVRSGFGAADVDKHTVNEFKDSSKNKVYNLNGYHKTSTRTVSVGDIYITYTDGSASQFIKVMNMKDGLCEVLIKRGREYSIEYLEPGKLSGTHYSKQLSFDIDYQVEKSYELSDNAKGIELFRYFKEKFGLEVKFAEFADDSINAKVYNNTIYINKRYADNASAVLNLAVHEFSHLAIAMLRMKDADTYVSMINTFQNMISNGFIPNELLSVFEDIDKNSNYSTPADRIEEKIVKFLDWRRKVNRMQGISSITELNEFLNKGFQELFGQGSNFQYKPTDSIQWVMAKYDNGSLFKDIPSGLNMLELKKRERRKHLLNDIIEKCY